MHDRESMTEIDMRKHNSIQTIILISTAIALASGCTRKYYAPTVPNNWMGMEADLRTKDGGSVRGYATRSGDQIVWKTTNGNLLDGSAIASMSRRNHSLGSLDGMLIGGGLGAGAGAIFGYTRGDDHNTDCGLNGCINIAARTKAVFGLVVGMGLGALTGYTLGMVSGSNEVYYIGDGTQLPQLSVTADQHGGEATLSWNF